MDSPERIGSKMMSKSEWVKHLESATGLIRPSMAPMNRELWKEAVLRHREEHPDCKPCLDRMKTKRSNANRRAHSDVYRSLGMVMVRGSLGGVYWE